MRTVARAQYRIDGAGDDSAWRELSRGTTIGYAKLDRIHGNDVRNPRVSIEDAVTAPVRTALNAY